MCGVEEGEEPLLVICPNNHRMHPSCTQRLLDSTFPGGMLCPLCRDSSLNLLVVTTSPATLAMMCTPFSALSSVIAMRIGAREIGKTITS
jgi:hypothetical protein